MFLSERMTSLKRNAINEVPLDLTLPTILSQPNVAFHLLPLSGTAPKAAPAAKASNPKKRPRSPRRRQPVKGKGGQKGRAGNCRGPSIPAGLIKKALETPQKQRLCWAYNLPNGCSKEKAAPRESICAQSRGVSNPIRFKTIVEASQSFTKGWSLEGQQISQVFALEIFAGTRVS